MRYMGGKFRQSKAIVECLRPVVNPETVYVEPFCGAMWSAARVIRELHPGMVILNDVNKPLMLLWQKCLLEGTLWLPTDLKEIEDNYQRIKHAQDMNNPLTAWYGNALSFGGKWFGGVARTDHVGQIKVMDTKTEALKSVPKIRLSNLSYLMTTIPDDSVVYCDPPYENRVKAHNFQGFDYPEFWQWVRDLSKRCFVLTSCFECPDDFGSVYEWGDTVVRHLNSRGSDGTNEKLVIYKEGVQYV